MTVWPSGLRRWLKAPFRKGVGSNPTAVTFPGAFVRTAVALSRHFHSTYTGACRLASDCKQKAQAHGLLGGFSLDYCYTQQNFQATSRVSIPHHTTSNTESKPWKADSSTEILPQCLRGELGTAQTLLDTERRAPEHANTRTCILGADAERDKGLRPHASIHTSIMKPRSR